MPCRQSRSPVFELLAAIAAAVVLGGCEAALPLVGPDPVPLAAGAAGSLESASAGGVTARASGGGRFQWAPLGSDVPPQFIVQFAFTALQQNPSGEAIGTFHFTSLDGFDLKIQGRVTCMTVDPENPHRAWIGGEITRNDSTNPFFTGPNSAVGKDSWFRVADYGEGAAASQPDRTTVLFFEPAGGFTTAAQFCASRLWFADDRLTNAVRDGNIQVRH